MPPEALSLRRRGLAVFVLVLSSLLVAGALAEGLLRAFTEYPIHTRAANRVAHEQLRWITDPSVPEIGADGFRNPSGLSSADLVGIGDSHTFGFNVSSRQSWPSQLAARLGITAYNLSAGGYGVLQYIYLFDRAIEREPETIIVALFLANDLADFCPLASQPSWSSWLGERGFDSEVCQAHGEELEPYSKPQPVRWLESTALASLFRYGVWNRVRHRFGRARDSVPTGMTIAYGKHETYVSGKRIQAHALFTDLSRPANREALRVLSHALQVMHETSKLEGITVGALLVPSRENVLFELADESHPLYPSLAVAVQQERALIDRVVSVAAAQGISTADPSECLRRSVGHQLYPEHDDDHPLAAGYACYAEAALDLTTEYRVR